MRECCRSARANAIGSGWKCRECGAFGGSTPVEPAPTSTEADNPWWVYSVRRENGYFPWACVIKVVTHRMTLPVLGDFIEITRTVHRMLGETPSEALTYARDWVDRFGAQRLQQTRWRKKQ
jgi:hypothetical protein